MPLTETEAEYLRSLVDDLRVIHSDLLEKLEATRAERDHLVQLATWAGLYIDARTGMTELSADSILEHLRRSLLTFHQQWGRP